MAELRPIADPFVAAPASGVSIRDRLKGLTSDDEEVLRLIGAHLGSLASGDLKVRCVDGLKHSAASWASRKRDLTAESSSRWAGSITKTSHDQWALARRAQAAHLRSLEAGVRMLQNRLSLPIGQKGSKRIPGGYRSRQEWFVKSRRLAALQDRLGRVRADRAVGVVHVVRGGRKLLHRRHNLAAAGLTDAGWRERWEAKRWFFSADGELGKQFGNETIRVTPDGTVTIKLPAPLTRYANTGHGRYTLAARVRFPHRGQEWADRIKVSRAVAYRIHYDTDRGRWYLDASWHRTDLPVIPLDAVRAGGVIGVDTNADHLAAWHLDPHGNPIGAPRRFDYDLSGAATHRDAQLRHALTRLLHWATRCGVLAIAIEDLDFTDATTREKHGKNKRFRQLISGIPTGRLKVRLSAMAAEHHLAVIAVDPAYTSRWGVQHWQKPLTGTNRSTTVTRHAAAAVAIGRRALGLPIRRRTAPPYQHQSDAGRHRTAQAPSGIHGREGSRPRTPGPRTRSVPPGYGVNTADQCAQDRSGHKAERRFWLQDQRAQPFLGTVITDSSATDVASCRQVRVELGDTG